MAIFLSLFVSFAIAQELPGTAWSLNPQLHFKEKTGAPKHSGTGGFSAVYVQGNMELQLKGTRIENAANAKQMCVVEFTNLENLYAARGNPYEGQITDVIQCDKTYKPRPFKFKSGDAERAGLLAGANERHLVGACARDQVAYWVSYSNFYDEPSKMVIETRLFLKAPKPDAKQVSELSKKLEQVTRELLVSKPKT